MNVHLVNFADLLVPIHTDSSLARELRILLCFLRRRGLSIKISTRFVRQIIECLRGITKYICFGRYMSRSQNVTFYSLPLYLGSIDATFIQDGRDQYAEYRSRANSNRRP